MKTKITTIVLGIFLIGIVSANLITHFGIISGSVEVTAPIFYLDGLHDDGGVYHKIYVNEEPPEEDIYFWDGHRLVFKTEDLQVNEFYKSRFTMKVWMKTNNSGNTMQARILKLDKDNHEQEICEVADPVVIGATSHFTKYTFSCESNSEIDLSDYNKISLELRGNGNESQEYWISVGNDRSDGMSRIEVTAI